MDKQVDETENKTVRVRPHRRWIIRGLVRKGVRIALIISLAIFALYTVGSMIDPGFSDRILFLLLQLLQYASLLLCAFSIFSMGFCVRRLVRHPHAHNVISLCFYFATSLLGAALAMLNSLIVATTGGYG
jgi:hypothetical protein